MVSNTPSIFLAPSTILLQHHDGGFLASDKEKISISSKLQGKFGHQVGVYQHAAGATIVDDWHCLGVYQGQ